VLVAVATARTGDLLAGGATAPAVALTEGFQAALLGGAAIALLAALLVGVLFPAAGTRPAIADEDEEPEVTPALV